MKKINTLRTVALAAIVAAGMSSVAHAEMNGYVREDGVGNNTTRESADAHVVQPTATHAGSGFYVGAFGGYGWNNTDGPGTSTFDLDGTDYGVFGGYVLQSMYRSNWIDLNGAIEAHYAWSNADDTALVGATLTRIEKDHDWGIDFRPGLTFLSTVSPMDLRPYAILGYRQAEFETTAGAASGKTRFDGFDLGIGTELVAYGAFGVRADYTHSFYESKNGLDPDEDDVRLGVAYHF